MAHFYRSNVDKVSEADIVIIGSYQMNQSPTRNEKVQVKLLILSAMPQMNQNFLKGMVKLFLSAHYKVALLVNRY